MGFMADEYFLARGAQIVKYYVFVAMLGILPGSLRASISLGPTQGQAHWKMARFGSGWRYPPDPETSRWPPRALFHYQAGHLLVATTVEVPGGRSLRSSNQYAIALDSAGVEKADHAQWDSAPALVTRVESPFHATPKLIDYKEVVYGERRFRGTGDRFNGNRSYALSPDGNWLALMSWQGKVPSCQDFFCDSTISRGQLFIEVFNVASGLRETALTGRFSSVQPFDVLDTVVWLSDRHLLVLTDGAKEAWIADMRPEEPARDAAWEVIQSPAEIIGFREEPPQVAYTHFLPGPKLQVGVRVPIPGPYFVRGNLVDSSGAVVPWEPSLFLLSDLRSPGLENLGLSFGPFKIKLPGSYEIRDVELIDVKRNVVARMANMGPTETYPDTLGLEKSLPKLYPPWWNAAKDAKPPTDVKATEVFGVLPTTGVGPGGVFQIAVLPAYRTWENIVSVELLFNDRSDAKGGCRISFLSDLKPNNDRRRLILRGDDDRSDVTSLLSENGIYSAKAVENSRCSVGNGWKPLLEGVTEIPVAFKPSFFGQKNIYVRVTDDNGKTSGWKQVGTWLASDERRPDAISVIPYLGSGMQRTFTFALSDLNGSTDVTSAEFLLQFGKTSQKACSFSLDRTLGAVTLSADQGTASSGSLRLGQPGQIGNSQCTLSDAKLKLEGRDAIALSVHIKFSSSFAGRRNVYARVEDKAGQRSSMVWLGSWVVAER
jgi:hypothetical protein